MILNNSNHNNYNTINIRINKIYYWLINKIQLNKVIQIVILIKLDNCKTFLQITKTKTNHKIILRIFKESNNPLSFLSTIELIN